MFTTWGAAGVLDADMECIADVMPGDACMDGDYAGTQVLSLGACVDTDAGSTGDSYGDMCAGYVAYPSWCGGYDDDDFDSNSMCCACGGGDSVPATEQDCLIE